MDTQIGLCSRYLEQIAGCVGLGFPEAIFQEGSIGAGDRDEFA